MAIPIPQDEEMKDSVDVIPTPMIELPTGVPPQMPPNLPPTSLANLMPGFPHSMPGKVKILCNR